MVNLRLINYLAQQVGHMRVVLITMHELSKDERIKHEFDATISYAQLLREHLDKIVEIREGDDV